MLKYLTNAAIGICLLYLLSACSTNTIVTQATSLSENEGLFVVEVVSNSTNASEVFSSLSIWSDAEKKVYYAASEEELGPDNKEMKSTAYFVAKLPAGKYWIDSAIYHKFEDYGTHYRNTTLTIPMHEQLGSFEVAAGEITDLGTIAYIPAPTEESPRRFYLALLDNENQFEATLKHKFPKLSARYLPNKTRSWHNTSPLLKNRLINLFIKKNIRQINSFFESNDGEIYVGGRLGQIFARKIDGRWISFDTGSTREITAVTKSASGDIHAAGENVLLVSRTNGASWSNLPLPSIKGRFLDIFNSPEDDLLLLIHAHKGIASTEYKILKLNQNGKSWDEEYVFSTDDKMLSKVEIPKNYAKGYFPNLRYAVNGNHYELGKNENITYPSIPGIRSPKYLPDGTLYGHVYSFIQFSDGIAGTKTGKLSDNVGIVFYDYKSGNKGLVGKWSKKQGYWVIDSAFVNRDQGWVLLGKNTRNRKKQEREYLYYTSNGGKSWKLMSRPTNIIDRLYVSSDGTLFIVDSDTFGDIYSSRDFGKSWKQERASNGIQKLFDMIEKRRKAANL